MLLFDLVVVKKIYLEKYVLLECIWFFIFINLILFCLINVGKKENFFIEIIYIFLKRVY